MLDPGGALQSERTMTDSEMLDVILLQFCELAERNRGEKSCWPPCPGYTQLQAFGFLSDAPSAN